MLNIEQLKKLRKSRGLTQEEVAELLCISQSAYARLENGTNNNGLFYLEKLCETFQISPLELLHLKINNKEIEIYKKKLIDKENVINFLNNRIHNLENTIKLFEKLTREK